MHVAKGRPDGWPALRTAAVVALTVTVALGAVSNVLFLAAFRFRRDWFDDPALLVAGGARSAELLRWASITDLFSYYLPTAVVALALGFALGPRGPVLARATTLAGLGYVSCGSTGNPAPTVQLSRSPSPPSSTSSSGGSGSFSTGCYSACGGSGSLD
jgi:hypothetical protein